MSKPQILPLKNKGAELFFVASRDGKAPQREGRLSSHSNKQGHKLHLHEYTHTVTHSQTQLFCGHMCAAAEELAAGQTTRVPEPAGPGP